MGWRPSRRTSVLLVAAAALLSLLALGLYAARVGPPVYAIGDLHEGHVGRWVEVVGEVQALRRSPSGLLLTLQDPLDLAEVDAFAPAAVDQALQGSALTAGALVRVRGEVEVYRGDLQIVLTSPRDVRVLEPASDGT